MFPNSLSFQEILEQIFFIGCTRTTSSLSVKKFNSTISILDSKIEYCLTLCPCVTDVTSSLFYSILYQNDGLMMMLWCLGNICGVYSPESSEHSLLQFSFVIPNKSSNHRSSSNLFHHHQPSSQPTLLQICKILTKFDKTEPN